MRIIGYHVNNRGLISNINVFYYLNHLQKFTIFILGKSINYESRG